MGRRPGTGRVPAGGVALAVLGAVIPASASGQEPGSRAAAEPVRPAADGLPGRVLEVEGPVGTLRVVDTGPPEPPGPSEPGEGDAATGRVAAPVPVVFVHSLAGSLEQWTPQLRRLAPARRAVALDLRAHGGSEVPVRPDYTVLDLAGDVLAVADSLGLDRFALVGHSLGGGVIAAAANRAPDRVAGLLFVDPVGEQRRARDEVVQFLFELDRDYRGTISGYWDSILDGASEGTRARVLRDLEETSPEAVIKALEGLLYFDPTALLADWRGPMLSVVTPQNDLPLSLHEVVPRLEAVTVEGTSHWLQLDAPEAFGRILDRFLARVDEAPSAG